MPQEVSQKFCPVCKTIKSRTEFYRVRRNKDGLEYQCSSCNKAKVKIYNRGERAKQLDRLRGRKYQKSEKGKQICKIKWLRYKSECPEKLAARQAVMIALRAGKLIKPAKCTRCQNEQRLHGHHHKGYEPEFWLDVEWLCPKCHRLSEEATQMKNDLDQELDQKPYDTKSY